MFMVEPACRLDYTNSVSVDTHSRAFESDGHDLYTSVHRDHPHAGDRETVQVLQEMGSVHDHLEQRHKLDG